MIFNNERKIAIFESIEDWERNIDEINEEYNPSRLLLGNLQLKILNISVGCQHAMVGCDGVRNFYIHMTPQDGRFKFAAYGEYTVVLRRDTFKQNELYHWLKLSMI